MLEMEPWTAAWILEKLWNMPSGIGSLIGAAMGLFAVAWAARKGLANLITAQEHQADLSRQRDFRLHEEHKQSLAIALRAEIAEIAADLTKRKFAIGAMGELKTAPRGYHKDHPRIELIRRGDRRQHL